MLGWYFTQTEKLRYGDNRAIAVGVTHTVDCEPVLCEAGLHASRRLIDALKFAPGVILYRVRLGGKIIHGDDKSVATERTYIKRLDADKVLRAFARKCALDVVHLWDCPEVVREYLETGDEKLRAAAGDAARNAAWAAAGNAAWNAAGDAAWAAAWNAAWNAAWAAAGAAAGDAARDAAGAAAWNAAWNAAWAAAWDAQNKALTKMVMGGDIAAAIRANKKGEVK